MSRDVRILVIGDEGAGKTALIASSVLGSLSHEEQRVLPEIRIPADLSPEGVAMTIVDSAAAADADLQFEARRADAVCIAYALDSSAAIARVGDHWLKWLRRTGVAAPVVLVGTKDDAAEYSSVSVDASDRAAAELMAAHPEIESAVRCSAVTLTNVSQVFYSALKAVIYPRGPLLEPRAAALRPDCAAALRRIFRIADRNGDGILDFDELDDMQRRCFAMPLQAAEFDGLVLLAQNALRGSDGAPGAAAPRPPGLTAEGFLAIHEHFVRTQRTGTAWALLRAFHYDDDLSLAEAYVRPEIAVPAGHRVELTAEAVRFLTDAFVAFDGDRDGALSAADLKQLFAVVPPVPRVAEFLDEVVRTGDGGLPLRGFLAGWAMMAQLDCRLAVAVLTYLGMEGGPRPASIKIVPAWLSAADGSLGHREVFVAAVVGGQGAGKSAILDDLIGRPFAEKHYPTVGIRSVANSVEVGGREKYLILQEVPAACEADVLGDGAAMGLIDAVVFVFDSSDRNSFEYVAKLREKHRLDGTPALFVGTKIDAATVPRRGGSDPTLYCEQRGLRLPLFLSMRNGERADVFAEMLRVCWTRRRGWQGAWKIGVAVAVCGLTAAALAALFLIKRRRW